MKVAILNSEDPQLFHFLERSGQENVEISLFNTEQKLIEDIAGVLQPDLVIVNTNMMTAELIHFFREQRVVCPVIYVPESAISKTIKKTLLAIFGAMRNDPQSRKPLQRIIVRKGSARLSVQMEKIAFFYSEMRMVFAVDFNGFRYHLDYNLNQIEDILDDKLFFRVNRQVIIHIDAVTDFRSIEFAKIEIGLMENSWLKGPLIISQYTAPMFKEWVEGL